MGKERPTHPEVRALLAIIEQDGWKWSRGGSGHFKIHNREGQLVTTVGATPSDPRGLLNCLKTCERAGLRVDRRTEDRFRNKAKHGPNWSMQIPDNLHFSRARFAEALGRYLDAHALTQQELADALSISAGAVSQWLRLTAQPSMNMLYAIQMLCGWEDFYGTPLKDEEEVAEEAEEAEQPTPAAVVNDWNGDVRQAPTISQPKSLAHQVACSIFSMQAELETLRAEVTNLRRLTSECPRCSHRVAGTGREQRHLHHDLLEVD